MIETLSSTFFAPSAEPLSYHLEITGIRFDQGDLSKPRYGSLIDPDRAPAGVQFEPALQLLEVPESELRFRFAIDPLQPVSFEADDEGNVKVRSVEIPWRTPPGLVSAKLVDGHLGQCELVWDQSLANSANGGLRRLAAMRLFCRPARDRELSAVEQVEGGIYLALVNRQEKPFPIRAAKDRGAPIASAIKILGSDELGRPVHDLFQPGVEEAVPAGLGLEPAFRVREGQIASFSLVLDLPQELADVRFDLEPGNQTEVQAIGFEPEARPLQLSGVTAGSFNDLPARRCDLEWYQETGRQFCATSNAQEATLCYCTQGQVASFLLRGTSGSLSSGMELDPTVIQPPSCTPDGICITP
jgi:hypothetical protein